MVFIHIYFFFLGGGGGLRLVSVIPHNRCSIVVLEEGVTGTYFILPVPGSNPPILGSPLISRPADGSAPL